MALADRLTGGGRLLRGARWLACAALVAALAGCNTASFDSVAPKTAPLPPPPSEAAALQSATTSAGATAPAGTATRQTAASDTTGAKARSTASRRSHGTHRRARTEKKSEAADPVPAGGQDRGTATKNAEFVEEGATQSETYPKFVPPKAATTQMTDAEKKAFEKQMAERMKANAPQKDETPAEYAERLKLMRALAAEHGEDTLKAIQKQ